MMNRSTKALLLGTSVLLSSGAAPVSANPTSLLLNDTFDTAVPAVFRNAENEFGDFTAGLALRSDIEDRSSESLVPAGALDPFSGGPINSGLAFGADVSIEDQYDKEVPSALEVGVKGELGEDA